MVIGALATRLALAGRLRYPAAQPLQLDPLDYECDGPVIDLEPA
jgi:hypothetical protein